MADSQIITPHVVPEGWFHPDPDAPPWVVPSKRECTVPPTIREVGIEQVLNRKVVSACCHLGSYGMGGAGLMGLELEGIETEYLVLCVWGADSWLHWDGKIIDDNTFSKEKKWGEPTANQQGHRKYEAEAAGTTLRKFELFDTHCRLELDDHVLEFREDPSTRPIFSGSKKQRIWNPKENPLTEALAKLTNATGLLKRWEYQEESLWDAWFLSPSWNLVV